MYLDVDVGVDVCVHVYVGVDVCVHVYVYVGGLSFPSLWLSSVLNLVCDGHDDPLATRASRLYPCCDGYRVNVILPWLGRRVVVHCDAARGVRVCMGGGSGMWMCVCGERAPGVGDFSFSWLVSLGLF